MLKKHKKASLNVGNAITLRAIVIGFLTLLMLIPLSMVNDIIQERSHRYHGILNEIAHSWGAPQTLQGPMLVIPYVEHSVSIDTVTGEDGISKTVSRDIFKDKTAIFLPDELAINANLKEEYRYRGIYESLVYRADIDVGGQFNLTSFMQDLSNRKRIVWDKAFLAIGLTDTKAILKTDLLTWNDKNVKLTPGTRLPELLPNGFSAPLKDAELNAQQAQYVFKLRMSLKGSKGLSFLPFGQTTTAHITSSWTHPSFQGNIPPAKFEIDENGFSAQWSIPHLARNYPQFWIKESLNVKGLDQVISGVDLFEPVSLYSTTDRSIKYGIIFIALTFMTLFIFELINKIRLHIVQYAIVGIALSVFYLILLSVAEQLGFLYAYQMASAITVLLIAMYTFLLLKKLSPTIVILLLLSGLYTALYFILQLEDYALLIGTGLLLFTTIVLMVVTSRLHLDKPEESPTAHHENDIIDSETLKEADKA